MNYLKIIGCLLLLLPAQIHVKAQGIFNQEKARLKKSAKQALLLATYAGYVKKGYDIVETGIHSIHDIKNGELGLHRVYYDELETVNPKIEKYPFVKETRTLYAKMQAGKQEVWKRIKTGSVFTAEEITYLKNVYTNLLNAAGEDIRDLDNTVKDGIYKMTDDERIRHIDAIYKRMLQKFYVLAALNEKVLVVLNSRLQQQEYIQQMEKLYGQKNSGK